MTEAERYKALAITYAEDRSRTVERANQVVADLGFAMSDALGAWATRDERTTDRIRQVVEIALFRLYRSKRRRGDVAAALAPALVGYTTAPEDYDHDYVKTVETFTVPDIGGKKDRQWRKIEVYDLDRFQNFQVPRYHSGFHGFQERDPRELAQERDLREPVKTKQVRPKKLSKKEQIEFRRDMEAKRVEQERLEKIAAQERLAATSFVWSVRASSEKGENFVSEVEAYYRDLLPYIKRTASMIRLMVPPTVGGEVRYAAHGALAGVGDLDARNRFDEWANASGGLDASGMTL